MGSETFIPFMVVWLRLTIMKLARRKNMMSMSGMISIRACFLGIGEATSMPVVLLGHGGDIHITGARFVLGFQHNFEVRRRSLQFELQVRHPRGEKVKRNQRENRDAETACGRDKRFRDTAGDRLDRELFVAEEAERTHQTGDRAKKTEQRRQRDQRIHDHEEATSALDLDTCGDLKRALERGV